MQNIVFPGRDKKVRLTFDGVDLNLATDIEVEFGDETYNFGNGVEVESNTTLALDLSSTQLTGRIYPTVYYIDAGSPNGNPITALETGGGEVLIAIGSILVIEDGSIVAGANSLASDADLKGYAIARGVKIPPTQPERESLLLKAMDYLFSVEGRLQGQRVTVVQELPFPREYVCARGRYIPSNEIPSDIKKAQIELALQAYDSDLLQSGSVQNVASEKLGDLETSYFQGGAVAHAVTEKANAYLMPYYKNGGRVSLVRV